MLTGHTCLCRCAWATPDTFTEKNFPCYEDGSNCVKSTQYVDPSKKFLD